ncbi:hypothetical protein L3Q82_002243 [Scomber scombrus]|uniref:Uncharacterized protein n=1 Tax=Scomber scombrus TaxID=13677 RepID=A0AAV1QHN8_SCOSC
MFVLLSLWFALLMSPCAGNAESSENKSTTEDYDDVTPTPDYDYTATFDYYIGNAESSEYKSTTEDYDDVTPTPDYDYTATFDYYFVTGLFHDPEPSSKASRIGPEAEPKTSYLQTGQ